jgi:hypothetical protein
MRRVKAGGLGLVVAVTLFVAGATMGCGSGKTSSSHGTTTTVPGVGTGGLSGSGTRTASAVAYGVRQRSTMAGPPPSLHEPAARYWNIDALVRDKFGRAEVCVQHYNVLVRSSGYCAVYYAVLFPSARQSAFRLVRLARNPVARVNVVPVRFYRRAGPYVSCGNGRWLALTNGRTQLWPVDCVNP